MQRDPDAVLVLVGPEGEMFLLSRATLARTAVAEDELVSSDETALRVLGALDPAFRVADLGIRTLGGVPAPVIAAPGILDDGEARLTLDEDGGYALLSRAMLEHVRVRPAQHEAVRQAIIAD